MKRTTITLSDDLADVIKRYRRSQNPVPDLTDVVNAAIRRYLVERGYIATGRILRLTPAEQGSGLHDISIENDQYFAE